MNRRYFCSLVSLSGLLLAHPGSIPLSIAKTSRNSPDKTLGYPPILGRVSTYITAYEDSLVDLARAHGLGYTEIVAANPGIDPWVPGVDTKIILPTAHIVPYGPRQGILINLGDQRLYFFQNDGETVKSVPLGIGSAGWATPKGSTTVVRKEHNPTWYVPKSVRDDQPELPAVVKPGPDNPLGSHAVYLGWPAYLFHGTNKPYGIGRRVSHGCIRLYPEDIARLFQKIQLGTKVTVVDQPMKLARFKGQLWLEIHPNQLQADEVERNGRHTPAKPPEFEYRLLHAAGKAANRIDWAKAKLTALERRGVPTPILK